jgi:phosphopantothenoylcysteine decarboxylase / phosphopantothenate---cysteine ligase
MDVNARGSHGWQSFAVLLLCFILSSQVLRGVIYMQHYFKDKKILIAVTGSIAAYKTLDLASQLRKLGSDVRVVMTESAKEFVTPLAFATLSQHEVLSNTFTDPLAHITWAKWADLILVAPATANFLAKYAQGYAEDLLQNILLATRAKIAIAPAMNQAMWAHSAVQENVRLLKSRGVDFIGPEAGLQACGDNGFGRMTEVDDILKILPKYFQPQTLAGKKILITAGPTQEALDPVRYLSNYSSGKMGYALAQSCYYHGAEVILISGPTALPSPKYCEVISVTDAQTMYTEVLARAKTMDIIIGCAAVCDFKPQTYQQQKIKKSEGTHVIELSHNEDILAAVGALAPKPLLVGFAAETENVIAHAQQKRMRKNLDLVIANQVSQDLGFNQDEHEVTLLNATQAMPLAKNTKTALADQIVAHIATLI